MRKHWFNGVPKIEYRTDYTNFGFRFAYWLWILRGSNSLSELMYYSRHVGIYSDNGSQLRGAYGPRILNWIGPDQLQEAIKTNQDVDDERDFVKPVGVNQLKAVFDDLTVNELDISTIVVRDPAIDFEESNDIPDLLSISVSTTEEDVVVSGLYEKAREDMVNDMFVLGLISEMFACWLHKKHSNTNIYIIGENGDDSRIESYGTREYAFFDHKFTIGDTTYIGLFDPNPNVFWSDLEQLNRYENHLRQMFTAQTFKNPAVNPKELMDSLFACILNQIETPFLREVGYILMLYVLEKYGSDSYQDEIIHMMERIGNPFYDSIANE
jgi:hypothetical protein